MLPVILVCWETLKYIEYDLLYKDGNNMEKSIIALATVVYGSMYADLLSDDLKDYSDKQKREALASLKEQTREKSLTLTQRKWLLDNTTC